MTLAKIIEIVDAETDFTRADELCLCLMACRPDLPQLSLDEWLIEYDLNLTPEEKRVGRAILDLYDTITE